MRRLFAFVLASLLGCTEHHPIASDGGPPDAGATTPYVLCDGTSEVRLGVEHQLSLLGADGPLTHPYGKAFLYVLGDCTYLAGASRLGAIVEGLLSDADADELVRDLKLDELGGSDGVRDACDDGDHYVVSTLEDLEYCSCECGFSPVLDAAPAVIPPLIVAGTTLLGGVEVAAEAVERDLARSYAPWPLTLDLSTVASSIQPFGTATVLAVEGDDADTLRAMRESDPDQDDGEPLYVEQAGATYAVYVLDIVPARFIEAIARFDDVTNPPPI